MGLGSSARLGCGLEVGRPLIEPVGALSGQFFSDMMILRDSTSARCSTWDRTGGNKDWRPIVPGEVLEFARIEGAGCVRHLYLTLAPNEHYLCDLVLRMYWDGSEVPCVETPFGDFFGMRYDRIRFYQSLMVTVNPGAGRHQGTVGFNCYFPMPFARGARFTLTNDGVEPVHAVWAHVDYERLSGLADNVGRFHAQWRRENPTIPVGPSVNETIHEALNPDARENYVILEAEGHGNVAGFFLHVDNFAGGWYGEGDDMIFIDGETWPPSIHGTGTEEIFGGGACPDAEYTGPYSGYVYVGNRNHAGKNSMYRFYVTDPIRFRKSIRMTIEHGHANNFRNDYSSTVFWYQNEPHAAFPPLRPPAERYPREGDDEHDRAFRALREYRRRISALRKGSLEKAGETHPLFHQLLAGFGVLDEALEKRENRRVLEECARLTLEVKKAEKELGCS